jgi:hypothetical protein
MLRDSRAGSRYRCLENPRPAGAEPSLTEDVTSPFRAEPRHQHTALRLEGLADWQGEVSDWRHVTGLGHPRRESSNEFDRINSIGQM